MPQLPNELILHTIKLLIPPSLPVSFPPWHPVTRTLISLTLASRFTYHIARELLFRYCLWIDSNKRLDNLINLKGGPKGPLQVFSPIGLFLSPFPDDELDDPVMAKHLDQLSSSICGSLRRLVIDIPLRSLYPRDDHQEVRPILRSVFLRLVHLEDFCSAQDELFCATMEESSEPAVWSIWPNLRRLALYNADVTSSEFIEGLKRCSNLTHLVLTRPDGLTEPVRQELCLTRRLPSLKKVVIVDAEGSDQSNTVTTLSGWHMGLLGQIWRLGYTRCETIRKIPHFEPLLVYCQVPVPPDRPDDHIPLCQEWVRNRAADGTLWDVSGIPLQMEDQR